MEVRFDSSGREIKSNKAWREECESLRQQLAECQSELADQKRLCVDDEMAVDLLDGFKHRIKFQCDMLPITNSEFDDYVKSPFGIKNWIRKQLDRLAEYRDQITEIPQLMRRLAECEREKVAIWESYKDCRAAHDAVTKELEDVKAARKTS